MRITPQKLLLTATFSALFVVGCSPGADGDGGEVECSSDVDCDGTDQCHPGLGICVPDCTVEDAEACPAEAPVCNGPNDDGVYPLEEEDPNADQAFRLICVCINDDSCVDGEVCDTETRECVPGQSDAGPQPDECEVDADCEEGEFCIDGSCQAECVDFDCIPNGELCRLDPAAADFNQCVIAESETAYCADANSAPAQSGPPHIVVYAHEVDNVTPNTCGENDDLPLRSFWFDVYSEVELEADHIYRANFEDDRFFPHDETYVEDVGDGDYIVLVFVCGNPNDIALYIDTGNAVSNAYCFDATP